MGSYFNSCIKWVGYDPESSDDGSNGVPEVVAVRVLEKFGKYSKVQIPTKKKSTTEIKFSEVPSLIMNAGKHTSKIF